MITSEHEILEKIKTLKEELLLVRKIRNCESCGERVFKQDRKCIHCHKFTTKYFEAGAYRSSIVSKLSTQERNKEIVAKLQTGLYTLEQLAQEYSLTRERIRQLHKNITGSASTAHNDRKRLLREQSEQKHLQQIKMRCSGCKKEITYQEGRQRKKYCNDCHNIRMNLYRNPEIQNTCVNCGITFNPKANYKAPSIVRKSKTGLFHNKICYFDSLRACKLLEEYYLGESFNM